MKELNTEQKLRIKSYYERTQYNSNNINKNLKEIFKRVDEIYNPITDIVVSITSNVVKELSVENEYLNENVWQYNNIQDLTREICTAMYLYGTVYVEVIVNTTGVIEYVLHNFENIEVVEEKGIIKKFKVKGTILQFNENGEAENREYEREYFEIFTENNKRVVKREVLDNEITTTPFSIDTIPVIKFKFDTTIYQALNIIDKINEDEAYIRSIFLIHGDPILQANNITPFGVEDETGEDGGAGLREKERLKEARHTEKTTIFTENGANGEVPMLKYIELINPLISDLQRDILRLEKKMIDLFPELILVDTTTQNVSSETFDMKNSGLKAKVQAFRKAFLIGLNEVDNIALALSNKAERVTQDSYKFIDIFKEQEKTARLNNISKTLEIIEKVEELELETEYETQIKEIKSEAIKDLNALYT